MIEYFNLIKMLEKKTLNYYKKILLNNYKINVFATLFLL